MSDFRFEPVSERVAAVDRAIRQSLADSCAAVLDEADRAGVPIVGDREAWRVRLLAGPAPARLWALYHALVQAVLILDGPAVASAAAALLAALPAPPPVPGRVLALGPDALGTDTVLYRSVIDSDPARPLDLQPPGADEVARLTDLTREARALMRAASPALADECDRLGHEIVLATNARDSFGGAATVFLWGAVMLNPGRIPDRVTLVESLAHECAHALLFGLTLGADLTTNGPGARYASPLRPDPRPIEGIAHATYVLARMIHALDCLLAGAPLTPDERRCASEKLARNRRDYAAGLSVVEAHARFTREGAAIFSACRAAMEAPARRSQSIAAAAGAL